MRVSEEGNCYYCGSPKRRIHRKHWRLFFFLVLWQTKKNSWKKRKWTARGYFHAISSPSVIPFDSNLATALFISTFICLFMPRLLTLYLRCNQCAACLTIGYHLNVTLLNNMLNSCILDCNSVLISFNLEQKWGWMISQQLNLNEDKKDLIGLQHHYV